MKTPKCPLSVFALHVLSFLPQAPGLEQAWVQTPALSLNQLSTAESLTLLYLLPRLQE